MGRKLLIVDVLTFLLLTGAVLLVLGLGTVGVAFLGSRKAKRATR